MEILDIVKNYENKIIEFRRDLHKFPELGLNLPKTMEYISKVLDSYKISYEKFLDGNGIVAMIEGNEGGKCLAIRADSDGLPIKEETKLDFASRNNNMHACGHDAHTAIALTTAIILNENKNLFKGTVKVIFQPAEEGPGGAKPLIEAGVLENPKVDRIVGLHTGTLFNSTSGKVGFKKGPLMAAVDVFKINVIGKGSHGAEPHNSIDPIVTASEIILSLQKIVSRELNPVDNAVVTVAVVQGGTVQNIIPNSVYIEGTVRTVSEESRKFVYDRINGIVNGICMANRCKSEIEYKFMYPAVINDDEFTDFVKQSAVDVLGEENVEDIKHSIMGAEDFAYYLKEIPGTFFGLANPKAIDGAIYPHHNSKFDIAEEELYKGVAVFVNTALKYLR